MSGDTPEKTFETAVTAVKQQIKFSPDDVSPATAVMLSCVASAQHVSSVTLISNTFKTQLYLHVCNVTYPVLCRAVLSAAAWHRARGCRKLLTQDHALCSTAW